MAKSSVRRQPPIAIVGIGGLFPGSVDVARFWNHVLRGSDLITDVPETHWSLEHYYDADPKAPDKTYARRGGFLPEVPFDSLGFGIPPNLLSSTDTSQLLGLLVARVTLEDCFGGKLDEADKSRVSVLLGCTGGQELFGQMASRLAYPNWRAGMLAAGIEESLVDEALQKISDTFVPWTESTFPGLLGNVVAGRIANRLNLGGTNAVTDAACASSFAALSMALDELVLGRADVVLTGGVDTLNDIFMHMCFSKTPALSASGDCRPFDEKADGTLLGEGLGMLALKRLEDAERDGNHIYAVLKGLGTSSDGRSKSVYAPVPEGQAKALKRAYEAAGYGPETVELVEAHGTGTKAGDVAELSGLKLTFDESGREERQWCAIGSVKSQIGHTKAAAGAAGLLKAALALHHKVLPPTIKVEKPNPKVSFEDSPFYVNTRARPWVRSSSHPRRASVSSFGFGGSNFHITLEEYTGEARAPRLLSRDAELFALSGTDVPSLEQAVKALAEKVTKGGEDGLSLATLARSTHEAFDVSGAERLAFVAGTLSELSKKLSDAARALSSGTKKAPGLAFGSGTAPGKVAFLFPGQGSQSLEMGAAVSLAFAASLSAFDEADDVALGEVPLSRVVFPPPAFTDEEKKAQEKRLTKTEWAQPALGATSVAFLRALEDGLGLSPALVGGHSFGELTALYAAGVLDYPSLLRLARRRGELMAEAASVPGGMVAVSGPVEKVREVLAESGVSDVVLANHNAPDQAVLSGALESLALVSEKMQAAGLRTRALQVATGFHSPLVAPASEGLGAFLTELPLGKARVPVYANTTAAEYPTSADEARRVLAEQVRSPVRFVEEVQAMYDAGARVFVEVGPGRVLTGLVGRILDGQPHEAVALDGRGNGIAPFFDGLARLLAAGIPLNLSWLWDGLSLDAPGTPPRGAAKKPALLVPIGGANTGKPELPAPKPPAPRPRVEVTASAPSAQPPASASLAPAPSPSKAPAPSAPSPALSASTTPQANGSLMAPRDPLTPPHGPSNGAVRLPSLPATSAPSTSVDAGWLTVFREGQQQTATAHAAFQRTMAEAHQAFLRAFELSTDQLSQLVGGGVVPTSAPAVSVPAASTPALVAPVAAPAVVERPAPVAPVAPPVQTRSAPPAAPAVITRPAPAPIAPVATASAPAAKVDVAGLLLEVASEKTGYPKDALSLDMSLEADLGIDSIKRVEILGTLRERIPGAPELEAVEMSQLSTLGEVAAYLERSFGPALKSSSAPTNGHAPSTSSLPPAAPSSGDLIALLFELVSERTRYPTEVLKPSMSLEADLGMDSIKRVELLDALRERDPSLPEVDAMLLSQLNTLGEIAEALGSRSSGSTLAHTSNQAPSATAASGDEVAAAFLDVVTEKTGYPKEALALEMSLEADLGIDSIKRVEILGAVRQRMPSLPEVDAIQLGQLATLGEIVSALSDNASTPTTTVPSSVPTATVAPAPAAAGSAPSGDEVAAAFLDVVAEKTGYPKEALALEMSLEADLGIDSIKRVEILGAVRQRMPSLPEVDAIQLGQLATLGEIVSALSDSAAAPVVTGLSAVPAAPTAPASTSTPSGEEVAAAFLDVVAEKTGYPKEALALEMSLEADLGIDSIKRVEILGAVRQRMPSLPEVDAIQLGQLATLGEIVSALSNDGATASTTSTSTSTSETEAPASTEEEKPSGIVRAEVALAPIAGVRAPLSLTDARVLVIDDGKGVAAQVAQELEARGARPKVLTDVSALDASAFEGTVGVVDLGGLAHVRDDSAALTMLRRSFDVARKVARALQAKAERGSLYCTVQDLGGSFGLGRAPGAEALLGGLAALAKTAAQEWPAVRVKALDVSRESLSLEALARVIVDEAIGGADALEVGVQGEERLTLVTRAAPLSGDTTPALGERPVIVATGGARGVTATSLEALAERSPGVRLVLFGRTDVDAELALPEASIEDEAALKQALFARAKAEGENVSPAEIGARAARLRAAQEVRGQLDRFRARGAEVLYLPVDVRDKNALHAALDTARSTFGPITGLVHGAGVLADKRLEDKTLDHFDLVIDTKVHGLLALLEATAQDPLRSIALFASVAGRFGNVGQADYAMANEALSKLAQREQARRGDSCLVKAYAWGPWEGGMVTPALRKVFESRGVALLPLAEGARFFADELSAAAHGAGVEVVFGGPLTAPPQAAVSANGAAESDEDALATLIDARRFDFLRDHSLRGIPVLPVVFAMELIARAAERRHPGLRVRRIHGLRVLRGLPLSRFTNGGNELRVRLSPEVLNGSGAPVRLRAEVFADGGSAPRYMALVDLGEGLEQAPTAPEAPTTLAPFPHDREAMYREMLFHGPRFQLVDAVEGASEDGIVATVRGTLSTDWGDESYRLDVGALDAGLQLAVLFGRITRNAPFLPTGIGRFTTHARELPRGSLRCVATGRAEGPDRVTLDVSFLDEDGQVLMVLSGIEAHRLLDDDAFRPVDVPEAASATP